MEQFAHEGRQRPVDDEERITVAEGPVRRPAREPDAVLHRLIVLEDEIGVMPGVVRPPEVARLEQRREDDERKDQDQRDVEPLARAP